MKQNEIIKGLHVRVSRHTRNAKGEETRFISCWPVSEADRKLFTDNHVCEVQFAGDPKTFTVGSEVKGDVLVSKLAPAMAHETVEDPDTGDKQFTGKLVPRLKLDADGNAIEDDKQQNIILQRAVLRFTGPLQLKKAKLAEELAVVVEEIK